jgi:excisionase family DNA binding protein
MSLGEPANKPLTVGEVAEYLRVSRVTVWRWCKSGKLPAFKIGHEWRIDPQWLKAVLSERDEPQGPTD